MFFGLLFKSLSRAPPGFLNQVYHASTLPALYMKMNKNMQQYHSSLPRLPVPPLQDSLEKYLRSVRPLVTDEEYHYTCKIVKEFGAPNGVGNKLHSALVKKSKSTDNWVSEWWKNLAYLSIRSSINISSLCAIHFNFRDFNSDEHHLRYSAKLVAGILDFKRTIENLTAQDVDVMSGRPLDMTSYYDMFAVCRIPGYPQDCHLYTHSENEPPKHIVVAHNDHFFSCDVYNKEGEVLNEEQLFLQFKKIVDESQEPQQPIGLLTTLHRDKWFKAYETLRKYDSINEKSMKAIQKSLFILCLDKPVANKYTPNRRSLVTSHLFHGGGVDKNSGNRWYDKSFQLIVNRDGTVGLTFEHSALDGQIFIRTRKHALEYVQRSESSKVENPASSNAIFPEPKKLKFNVSKETVEDLDEAKRNIKRIIDDYDVSNVNFYQFGWDFIKSRKMNPDSFIQMALQLGFYKIHGEASAVYETASTRQFLLGRTEVIRSTTVESVEFCRKMMDKSASPNSKIAALRNAINVHQQYAIQATNGMGIDRLFLGLKQIALESEVKVPELLENTAYQKSTNFRISSSQVPMSYGGFGAFGVLVPDGYGCCYNPQSSYITLPISASNSCSKTKAEDYSQAVVEALNEMHDAVIHSPI